MSRTGRPARLRATYHRTQGVRHMFGALDLPPAQLYYRIRDRKRWTEFLAFLESLRARWPGEKFYLILDSDSVHKRREGAVMTTLEAVARKKAEASMTVASERVGIRSVVRRRPGSTQADVTTQP
ncbi:hypothetical protein [Nocardia sputorum]|uniref:hypothetical protein n=1 Tax=Nocardia sputorum TaxID=2984338 RepID=UPI0024925DF3|nr:hypothetical protein [Nocardia sputorum]